MSKNKKSKNATIKKAKKLERQGKYKKALSVCDRFLDEKIEESVIQLKIDIIVESYNNDEFIGKLNKYKVKLTDFLTKEDGEEFLRIYTTFDTFFEMAKESLGDDNTRRAFLGAGLLLDNLETILVLNEMSKENNKRNLEKTETPIEIETFVNEVKKTAYQFLEIIIENPKESIAEAEFDLEVSIEKIKKLIEPENPEEESNIEEESSEEAPNIVEESSEEEQNIEEESSEETQEESNIEVQEEDSNPENENLLKVEDDTELKTESSLEHEIKCLKKMVDYHNEKNDFKKALEYQRRLVKLAKEEKILTDTESDSKQKSIFDF
ncbi:hypothetical protein [uncultured Methanobrevibacter sp.]|uniref:hypothetical protein n=1 Tax=uncultured Methanobrevibacter sp. TaxID=253161 RepID=UPI002617AB4A